MDATMTELTPDKRRHGGAIRSLARVAPGLIALLALFTLYATFRQRYVGACDWYGYYAQSRLLLEGRLTMPLSIDISRYPAAVPLSYEALDGRAIPRYPPGYPLMLALGGVVGAEFLVTPACAALSVWVLYLILIRRVSKLVAVLLSAAWALCPIVVWGAGNLMSDLPAALVLMTCYCLLDRDRPALAGAVFVLAVATRPTNALFGLLLLPLFGDWRRFARFAVAATVGGAAYGLYNWEVFGAPWRMGYRGSWQGFGLASFPRNFPRYGWHLLTTLTIGLHVPALLGMLRRHRRSLFFLGWFLLYWILYSFWWVKPDPWWYLRFLLPGLPGLFILAADGMEDVRRWLEAGRPRWRPAVQVVYSLAAVALVTFFVGFCRAHQCFSRTTAKVFHDVAVSARERLPGDALIGAFNHSGSLRLYGGFDTFQIPQPTSMRLVDDTLRTGRPVYLLLESSLKGDPMMQRLLKELDVDQGTPLEGWPNTKVVRVLGRKAT